MGGDDGELNNNTEYALLPLSLPVAALVTVIETAEGVDLDDVSSTAATAAYQYEETPVYQPTINYSGTPDPYGSIAYAQTNGNSISSTSSNSGESSSITLTREKAPVYTGPNGEKYTDPNASRAAWEKYNAEKLKADQARWEAEAAADMSRRKAREAQRQAEAEALKAANPDARSTI